MKIVKYLCNTMGYWVPSLMIVLMLSGAFTILALAEREEPSPIRYPSTQYINPDQSAAASLEQIAEDIRYVTGLMRKLEAEYLKELAEENAKDE